jgi:hypothetical protein
MPALLLLLHRRRVGPDLSARADLVPVRQGVGLPHPGDPTESTGAVATAYRDGRNPGKSKHSFDGTIQSERSLTIPFREPVSLLMGVAFRIKLSYGCYRAPIDTIFLEYLYELSRLEPAA